MGEDGAGACSTRENRARVGQPWRNVGTDLWGGGGPLEEEERLASLVPFTNFFLNLFYFIIYLFFGWAAQLEGS